MKKLITLLFVIITFGSNAQITLEHVHSTGVVDNQAFTTVKLSSSGYKYVSPDLVNGTITLYNLNHTVFKTLTYTPLITPSTGQDMCFYISETLFNLDSNNVEFLIRSYSYTNSLSSVLIFEENGTLLFQKDSVNLNGFEYSWYAGSISYTTAGTKLRLSGQFTDSVYIYSLPGNLVCNDCTDGIISSMAELSGNPQNGGISKLYPNPTSGQTTVEYSLPQGITKADLVVYDMQGHEIKRYKVTNAFNTIIINANELAAGTYYYQIQSSAGFNAGKKMIVIK